MNYAETRLAQLARDGDRNAFAQLVELYKMKIYHLAYRMLSHQHEAEDIVQETFFRVYKNLHRYDDQQKFSTWIYRIGTNLCIDWLRKHKANYSLDAGTMDDENWDRYSMLQSEDMTPENQVMLAETQVIIRKAIDTLPEKYKSIIILRYFHDMSLQEISNAVKLPITTVKTRVHRGREALKKKLNLKNLFISMPPTM